MDGDRVVGLKNGLCKVRKVFLVLFPQIVIYKLEMSVFKDFKVDIVVNVVHRRKVDFLSPLLLTFTNLLTNVHYTI